MRNRDVIEFLGPRKRLHNPNFNPLEFEGVKKQIGANDAGRGTWIQSEGERIGGIRASKIMRKKIIRFSEIIESFKYKCSC